MECHIMTVMDCRSWRCRWWHMVSMDI